jgi:hypothetical protein
MDVLVLFGKLQVEVYAKIQDGKIRLGVENGIISLSKKTENKCF